MLKNLKEINLTPYRECCNNFYSATMPLREVEPDFLDLACINEPVVDLYLLINLIACAQASDDNKEIYLKKDDFSKYINSLLKSLTTIHQISVLTKSNSLFDRGVKISEFGLFKELLTCYTKLLCKTVGGSNEATKLINEYLNVENKGRDLDALWEKLNDLNDKEIVEGYAIFINDDGSETKLGWDELKLEENGKKYGYKANLIEDKKIQDDAFRGQFEAVVYYSGCPKLKEINIQEGVEYIGFSAFYNCSQLNKVILPSTLKEIKGDAFYNTAIKEIEIPEGIEKIWVGVFFCCHQLEKVVLPSTLKEIRRGAFGNTAIKEIVIPGKVDFIYERAFENCKQLKKIVMSIALYAKIIYNTGSLESIGICSDDILRLV